MSIFPVTRLDVMSMMYSDRHRPALQEGQQWNYNSSECN